MRDLVRIRRDLLRRQDLPELSWMDTGFLQYVLHKLDYGICHNRVDERSREDPERLTTSAGFGTASRKAPQQDHSGVILILPSSSLSNVYLHIFSPRWTFFFPPRLLPSCDSGFSFAGTNSMSDPLAAFPLGSPPARDCLICGLLRGLHPPRLGGVIPSPLAKRLP